MPRLADNGCAVHKYATSNKCIEGISNWLEYFILHGPSLLLMRYDMFSSSVRSLTKCLENKNASSYKVWGRTFYC